jgi:hypothetical protein
MNTLVSAHIKNPLSMVAFYLAWIESAFSAGLFATKGIDAWPRTFLIVSMGVIGLIYAGVVAFVLVYIVCKYPQFLFNTPSVQHLLFPQSDQLQVANVTAALEKPLEIETAQQ